MEQTPRQSPLSALSPAQIFVFGIVAGILVLCTIGFFITLSMVLGNSAKGSAGGNARVAAQPSVQVAAPAPGNPAAAMPPISDDDHIRGASNPTVVLVEYSDFECPFCGRFHPTTKQALDEYPDDVAIVYRHFPLSFHPEAIPAAVASECADEQGKFWEFHDKLFENQTLLSSAYYKQVAGEIGLNNSKFDECVSSGKYTQKIQDQQAGGAAAGVAGTPHTLVLSADGDSQVVSGAQPYAVLKAAIDSYLN